MDKHSRFFYLYPVFLVITIILAIVLWINATKSKVVVEWSTASELSTVGFTLYRSESSAGPYLKITDGLIPASDPLTGGEYSYEDTQVESGHMYYYILEDIDENGITNRHGPIEVQANPSGLLEKLLAAALVIVDCLGLFTILMISRKRQIQKATT